MTRQRAQRLFHEVMFLVWIGIALWAAYSVKYNPDLPIQLDLVVFACALYWALHFQQECNTLDKRQQKR